MAIHGTKERAAKALGVQPSTVKSNLMALRGRTGMEGKKVVQIVWWAVQKGFLDPMADPK